VAEENMTLEQKRGELHGLMVFAGSLAYGLEQMLGRGATSINFRAGRNVGLKVEVAKKTGDLMEALDVLRDGLAQRGINWEIKPWKAATDDNYVYEVNEQPAIKLSFHNCMVRCTLFRFSHEQKLSMCQMEMGLLCGMLENITGRKAVLKVLHAGENACFKELALL
jgi:predicted hydrocarbon binding protein